MTKTYTLIAYRPDGYDSCSNSSSPSDFECHVFSEQYQLVEHVARTTIANEAAKLKDYGRSNWEFKILIDGVDEDNWWVFHEQDTGEYTEADADHFSFWEMGQAIDVEIDRLKAAEKAKAAAVEAQRKIDAAIEVERRRVEKETNEKALLKELIEKHGMPIGANAGEEA